MGNKVCYEAVNEEQLKARLGNNCSPGFDRHGYLIGPDVNGRLCHIGSYYSLGEAQRAAKSLNN